MIHKETRSCGATVAIRSLLIARVRVAVKMWRRQHQHLAGPVDAAPEPCRGEHGGGAVLEQTFEALDGGDGRSLPEMAVKAPSVDVRRRTARIGFGAESREIT